MKGVFDFSYRLPKRTYALLGSCAFLVILFAWYSVTSTGLIKEFFLPSPLSVGRSLIDLFAEHGFWKDCQASFYRITIGYLLAVCLAVPLGILMGSFHICEAFLEPLNNFVRYTPLPAFIPLIVLWCGIGDVNQITVIFLGVFFSLLVMVADSVSNMPKELLETAYTLGIKRKKVLLFVILPNSLPGIYDSLRVAIGWAWSSLIMAEVVGANTGIGHMIMESQRFLRTANVMAGILVVGLLGILLDYLFKAFYPLLFRWTEKSRRL